MISQRGRKFSARAGETAEHRDGKTVTVATVYDLLMAQYGVRAVCPATTRRATTTRSDVHPSLVGKVHRHGRQTLIRFAREWGRTAELTKVQSRSYIGAGINHWYTTI